MFSSPSPEHGPDGVSETRPIHLPGVKAREFERLLDFFYKGYACYKYTGFTALLTIFRAFRLQDGTGLLTNEPTNDEQFIQQWVDLLSIATRFDFQNVRECAIEVIEKHSPPLDPVERLCLAEKHDIQQWIAPAFESLCQRRDPLEIHEAERIGLRNTALLARAREAIRVKERNHLLNRQPPIQTEEPKPVPRKRHITPTTKLFSVVCSISLVLVLTLNSPIGKVPKRMV